MLRVVVDDGESTATFELANYLLQGITSLSYNDLVMSSNDLFPLCFSLCYGLFFVITEGVFLCLVGCKVCFE